MQVCRVITYLNRDVFMLHQNEFAFVIITITSKIKMNCDEQIHIEKDMTTVYKVIIEFGS